MSVGGERHGAVEGEVAGGRSRLSAMPTVLADVGGPAGGGGGTDGWGPRMAEGPY